MEKKYFDLLDDEVLAFIKQTDDFYPPDAVTASIPQQRDFYNGLCQEFHINYPDGVKSSDRCLRTRDAVIPLRDYEIEGVTPRAHIVFYHGGGFVVGGLESHDSICAEFCGRTGCSLTAVDYRLSPEHVHPAAFDDAFVAFKRIAKEKNIPIILVGDSAGGNLAAAVSHAARSGKTQPVGQVLIYPALGGDMAKGSYIEHANAPALTTADMDYYHEARMGGPEHFPAVEAMPLLDSDFSGLPPTVIFSAECDPLADDGCEYCTRIQAAGQNAKWFKEQGLVHGYLRARGTVKRAADSISRMVASLNMMADGRWNLS